MAEIRINATGGVKLYDADDSHYAQIIAGTITSNTDVMTLGHNVIDIPMTTASSSATTGALTIGGGLGVAADLYIGDDTYLITDSAVLGFGADKDTTLTHTDGTGLTLNSTNKLCFNDASQFIQGSSNAILSLGATDEIDLTATAVDLNGTLDVSGASQFNGDVVLAGTTPTLTIGDAGTEDTAIIFDGNAIDYYIGLDDSGDEFQIGKGSTLGAGREFSIGASGPVFNEDSDTHDFRIETDDQTHAFFIHGSNDEVSINESASDTDAGGLCINHGSGDAIALSLKNSDVAHSNTDSAEADTYAVFEKYHSTGGGLKIQGWSEITESGLHLRAYIGGTPKNGEATNMPGILEFNSVIASGSGTTTPAADDNAATFSCNGDVEFIIKGDGELFSNQSATVGTYDTYEDAQLIRAYDLSRGKNLKGLINSKFDKFVKYNQKDLADAKLIGKDENGNPTSFVNITGMSRLHNGAIWQQYEKHQQLLDAVYDLAKEAVGEEKANAILDKHEVKRLQ